MRIETTCPCGRKHIHEISDATDATSTQVTLTLGGPMISPPEPAAIMVGDSLAPLIAAAPASAEEIKEYQQNFLDSFKPVMKRYRKAKLGKRPSKKAKR